MQTPDKLQVSSARQPGLLAMGCHGVAAAIDAAIPRSLSWGMGSCPGAVPDDERA